MTKARRELAALMPSQDVVLEILEDVEPDAELLAKVAQLRLLGFKIALDDFVARPGIEPLLEVADIVKIDILRTPPGLLCREVEALERFDVQLVAEKVETEEQFSLCRALGFELFQGYHFSRPEICSMDGVLAGDCLISW